MNCFSLWRLTARAAAPVVLILSSCGHETLVQVWPAMSSARARSAGAENALDVACAQWEAARQGGDGELAVDAFHRMCADLPGDELTRVNLIQLLGEPDRGDSSLVAYRFRDGGRLIRGPVELFLLFGDCVSLDAAYLSKLFD